MSILRTPVPSHLRIQHTHDLFGVNFPLSLEPLVYAFAGNLSNDYSGGYWNFYTLSNGGFYMAPDSDTPFKVNCENGFEGSLSADALGIAICLYAYSHLSFSEDLFIDHYYWLRDFMLDHPEAESILRAID